MELPACGLVIVSTLRHWKNWRHTSLSSLHARCRRGHSPLSLYIPLVVQYDNYSLLLFVDGGRFFSLNLTVSALGWFQENSRWCQGGQSARPWGSSTTGFVTCLLVNHCLFLLGYWSKLLVACLLDSFSNKKMCRCQGWTNSDCPGGWQWCGLLMECQRVQMGQGQELHWFLLFVVAFVMWWGWEVERHEIKMQYINIQTSSFRFHASQLQLCSWSVAHVYKLVRLVQSTWSFWSCWVLL
jgi:hypothetical protein